MLFVIVYIYDSLYISNCYILKLKYYILQALSETLPHCINSLVRLTNIFNSFKLVGIWWALLLKLNILGLKFGNYLGSVWLITVILSLNLCFSTPQSCHIIFNVATNLLGGGTGENNTISNQNILYYQNLEYSAIELGWLNKYFIILLSL